MVFWIKWFFAAPARGLRCRSVGMETIGTPPSIYAKEPTGVSRVPGLDTPEVEDTEAVLTIPH
jgi:hypothetical protein